MFVWTVRAQTVKLGLVVSVALSILLILAIFTDAGGMVAVMGGEGAVEAIAYTKLRTDAERMAFIRSLGWETTGEVVEEESFTVPKTFDRVLLGYNEIQKDQGLDLSRYRRKKVTRYTYEVTNYQGYEGKVYINLIVYKNRVVAGDVSSADPMGFVQGLERPT